MGTPTTISLEDSKHPAKMQAERQKNVLVLREQWERRIKDLPELKEYYETEVSPRFIFPAPLPSQLHPAHSPTLFHRRAVRLTPRRTRHILISDIYTLADLHEILVDAFHFDDDHLHEFIFKQDLPRNEPTRQSRRKKAVKPRESHIMGLTPLGDIPETDFNYLETEVRLWDFYMTVGTKLRYIFDFGTTTRVDIILEEVLPADAAIQEPKLLPQTRRTRKRHKENKTPNHCGRQ